MEKKTKIILTIVVIITIIVVATISIFFHPKSSTDIFSSNDFSIEGVWYDPLFEEYLELKDNGIFNKWHNSSKEVEIIGNYTCDIYAGTLTLDYMKNNSGIYAPVHEIYTIKIIVTYNLDNTKTKEMELTTGYNLYNYNYVGPVGCYEFPKI